VLRLRLDTSSGHAPKLLAQQVVANRIPWRDDKTALAIGPTGVALAHNGTLYVADTLASRIIAIPNAMTRSTPLADTGIALSTGQHLKQPLGLALAPNGDILTTNAGDGNIVETTPAGHQVATMAGDAKAGAGSLFGISIAPGGKGIVYVDDASNTLRLLH
jgi:sugar lactone lactonase YvrE